MFVNHFGTTVFPFPKPPDNDPRKRKREEDPKSDDRKKTKIPTGFENILPIFLRAIDPVGHARFEDQLALIQEQLRLRKASKNDRQEVIQIIRGFLRNAMIGDRELAELAALSVLLDQPEIPLSAVSRTPSFLKELETQLINKIEKLKHDESPIKWIAIDRNLPPYYERRLIELFAEMTYLTNNWVNPAIGALTSYLLKETRLRLFVHEDHLQQLCAVTASVSENSNFVKSCQAPIEINPSLWPYFTAIVLKSPRQQLSHCSKIRALFFILLSRLRQSQDPICYAITSITVDKNNTPLKVFDFLKNMFVTGSFTIQGAPLPVDLLFELFIRRIESGSLQRAFDGEYHRSALLADVVFRITGRSTVTEEDLLDPEVYRILLLYFNQMVHLPLIIPEIIKGINFYSESSVKTTFINTIYRNLSFQIGSVFPIYQMIFRSICIESFWFVDLLRQPNFTDEKGIEILSGPLKGRYPIQSNSLMMHFALCPRVLFFYRKGTITLCLNEGDLLNTLTQIIEEFPCSTRQKNEMISSIQGKPKEILAGLISAIGGSSPNMTSGLDPTKTMVFRALGGFFVKDSRKEQTFHLNGCLVGMAKKVLGWINPQCNGVVPIERPGHVFTLRVSFMPPAIDQVKKSSERIARELLSRIIPPESVTPLLHAVNRNRAQEWLSKIQQLPPPLTYKDVVVVIRSTEPKQSQDIDRASQEIDSRLLRIYPTIEKIRAVVERLSVCPAQSRDQFIEGVTRELDDQPADSHRWAEAVFKVSAALGLPYLFYTRIQQIVARELGVPGSIYFGDMNWGLSDPVYSYIEYNLCREKWELTDRIYSKAKPISCTHINVYQH